MALFYATKFVVIFSNNLGTPIQTLISWLDQVRHSAGPQLPHLYNGMLFNIDLFNECVLGTSYVPGIG